MSLKNFIAPTVFSLMMLAITFVIIGVYIDDQQEKLQQKAYTNKTQEIQDLVKTLIENKQEKISLITLSLAQDDKLKKALLNKNNQLSYDDYLNALARASDFKNIWLHIIDEQGRSFYRSWTQKHGDNILDKRLDLQQMFKNPKPMQTISTGIYDLTFKSSVPIYDNKKFIGVFETIAKFNSIAIKLKQKNIEPVFLVDKSYHTQLKRPFTQTFLDDYYVANLNANPERIQDIKQNRLIQYSHQPLHSSYYVDQQKQQLITYYELPNLKNEPMGHFFFFYPLDKIENDQLLANKFSLYFYAAIGYLFFLIIYFYQLNKREKIQITEFNQRLTESVHQKTRQLTHQKYFLQNVIDGVSDSVVVYDKNLSITLKNKAAEQLIGLTSSSKQYSHGVNENSQNHDYLETVIKCLKSAKPEKTVHHFIDQNQTSRYFEFTVTPLVDGSGQLNSVIQLGHEITNYLDIQEQLQQQKNDLDFIAYHDPLTDLPNRILFLDRLNQAIHQAQRNHDKVALLFIDLDRFKEINDSFGHASGDLVLIECGKRLKKSIREIDTVARLGGDEFTILIDELKTNNVIINVVKKIIKTLSDPIIVNENIFHITASIGISIFPNDGTDANQLLQNADAAMYQAKEDGKNTYHFYTKEMTEQAYNRLLMENNLRDALDNQQFELYYQPQVDITTNKIVGFEALVRWNHEQKGIIPPDHFIPLAEETGLIIPLGKQIIAMASQTISEWHQANLTDARIAINVSAKQLRDSRFFHNLNSALSKNNCQPDWIEIEITESSVMQNPELAIKLLSKLRRKGITISIDDFGTGYSSLAYLKKLPITKVKIDRSFVSNLPQDKDDAEITKAIISMSQSLNLDIIAEGIETQEQQDFVLKEGCQLIQGYYYSRPLTKQAMTEKLENIRLRKA